jgi:flavin reductase (DIM6/NTAB) family NADH-FMN oxidoreductase RutF
MADLPPFAPALGRLVSGLYIVTTGVDGDATGMLGSWVQQAGFEPPAVTVAMDRDRAVTEVFRACGHFCISVLAPSSMHLLKHFAKGFAPGENAFEGLDTALSANGVPYLVEAHAHLACKIIGESTWTDHVIFCGEVVGGSCASLEEAPATHIRKNGLSY